MSSFTKSVMIMAGLWFLAFTTFSAYRSDITLLFFVILTLGMLVFGLVSLIYALTRWRSEQWKAVVPLGFCILAIVIAPLGRKFAVAVQHITFQRSLPFYESIVRQMESGIIPVSAELRRVPQAEGRFAYAVLAQRSSDGVLSVEFLTERCFPLKHVGYLYCSSGKIAKGTTADSRWSRRREMAPLWFRISD